MPGAKKGWMEQVRGWGLRSWTVLPRGCSRSRASTRVLARGPDTPARFLLQGTPCGRGPTCSTQGPSTLTLQRALLLSSQTWAAADFTFPYFIYNQKHQLPPAQGPHQAPYGGRWQEEVFPTPAGPAQHSGQPMLFPVHRGHCSGAIQSGSSARSGGPTWPLPLGTGCQPAICLGPGPGPRCPLDHHPPSPGQASKGFPSPPVHFWASLGFHSVPGGTSQAKR